VGGGTGTGSQVDAPTAAARRATRSGAGAAGAPSVGRAGAYWRSERAAAVAWTFTLSAIADLGLSQAVPFYAAQGYEPAGGYDLPLPIGRILELRLMTKRLIPSR